MAQLVYPNEMNNPRIIACADEVGVDPTSKDFTFTEFKQYKECLRRNNIPYQGDV